MKISFLIIVFSMLFSSLSGAYAQVNIKHELGITTVPEDPQRIVVLEYSFIDALASIRLSPVGIADDGKRESIVPEYTKIIGNDWTSVGTRKSPSIEVIASLNPDLIIADKSRHATVYPMLSEIAPTIVYNSLGGDYHDAIEQMYKIGEAVGKGPEMEVVIQAHKERMTEFVSKISPHAKGVVAQFGVATAKKLWLHSPISYNGSLLKLLGFDSNITPSSGDGVYASKYLGTTLEQLSEINPELFFVGEHVVPSIVGSWSDDQLFKDIDAVKNGTLYKVDTHHWGRLRGVLAVELVSKNILEILVGANK